MSPRTVRPGTIDDLSALIGLYTELAEGDPARVPSDSGSASSALQRILDESGHNLYVVDEEEGEVVGAAELIVVSSLTHHGRPWAVIENVIVRETARGRGAGADLLRHLLEVARDAGCYKVQLLSGKQRKDAHRLYRRIGFEPVAGGFKLYFDDTRSKGP